MIKFAENEVNIEDIVENIKGNLKALNERLNSPNLSEEFIGYTKSDIAFLEEALDKIEYSIYNPEVKRKRIVQKYIGDDPYCFCVIPNYDNFEKFDTIKVVYPYEGDSYEVELG